MAKRTAGAKTSSHVCRHPFEQLRRDCAAKRQEARAKLSAKDQIEKLDAKLGAGQGAKKERARLAKQIEEAKT